MTEQDQSLPPPAPPAPAPTPSRPSLLARTPRRFLLGGVALLIAVVLAIVFRGPLVSWFGGGATSGKTSAPATTSAGTLVLDATVQPDPPRQQDNRLSLALRDSSGQPITGAHLVVTISMPPMGGTAEMRVTPEVTEREGGIYQAGFDLAMGGTWTVTIEAHTPAAGTLNAEYSLTVGTSGLHPIAGAGAGSPSTLASHEFAPPARDALLRALRAYDEIRKLLAADRVGGISVHAESIVEVLGRAHHSESSAPPEVHRHLELAGEAAGRLSTESDIVKARAQFQELSANLVSLVAADPRLAAGSNVYECPMTEGFNKWLQPEGDMANPYMGSKMLTCGSEVKLADVFTKPADEPPPDPEEISHYTCPMHPWVKQSGPGTCPVCSMDLTPVTKGEVQSGIIRVDTERRQIIGVRTHKIGRGPLMAKVRAIGEVAYDERGLADVSLRFGGYIEKLHVEETGQYVKRGQTLFTVYSPEIYAAQQEYLLAVQTEKNARDEAARARAQSLVKSTRRRLELWGVSRSVLSRIAASGEPIERVPVVAPVSGYVVDKDIVEGGTIEMGKRLYRIAALDRVWVEARVYEQDIALIRKGQKASVTLTHISGKVFEGKVSFIYPYLDGMTRTARVRIELDNPDLQLKPNMYANVDFEIDVGERLLVPEAAVIYSGPRRIVFVDIGNDKLKPQIVEVGIKSGGFYEVLRGLEPGDEVVVSGNFLLASESRLKSATGLW